MSPTLISEMGSAASVTERKLERLQERDVKQQLEQDKYLSVTYFKHNEEISKLRTRVFELSEHLRKTEEMLEVSNSRLEEEQRKNVALMFSDLPLNLFNEPCGTDAYSQLSKTYEMVTVAQCDIVNFSSLTSILKPHDMVSLIDHLQAIIDKAFINTDIFIMERYIDGCIAVTGLADLPQQGHSTKPTRMGYSRTMTPISQTDSSYGSEIGLSEGERISQRIKTPVSQITTLSNREGSVEVKSASYYASTLATAALKLMSLCTAIKVPHQDRKQVQLRIALHSGPCSAGVVGLQVTAGTIQIPHYKLFGNTIYTTAKLCSSGLALQIRVSKTCYDLLLEIGGYKFERCPDFVIGNGGKPLESYWLVGGDNFDYPLPSLDLAISLSDYDELNI